MSTNNITSANSVLMLGILGLFTVPQQLQGFSADDAYSIDPVDSTEVIMGVDGVLSSGWIPQIKTMNVTLQADSLSNTFFEAWYAAQEANKDTYPAFGVITQPSVSRTYTLKDGILANYAPISDSKKTLQPRKFQIKWGSVIGAPI